MTLPIPPTKNHKEIQHQLHSDIRGILLQYVGWRGDARPCICDWCDRESHAGRSRVKHKDDCPLGDLQAVENKVSKYRLWQRWEGRASMTVYWSEKHPAIMVGKGSRWHIRYTSSRVLCGLGLRMDDEQSEHPIAWDDMCMNCIHRAMALGKELA